ncbi:MAG: XkdX family protein [Clostridia bacterium]|nr:XkdX family protein [Clostridia bacterium]
MWLDVLKGLYDRKRINSENLQNAVTAGIITQEEYDMIIAPTG